MYSIDVFLNYLFSILLPQMNQNYDYLFKIIVVGSSGVGKTSLILRYVDNSFNSSYTSTIGVDFKIKTFQLNNETIKLQLWDTAGQERFKTITNSYYRGAHGILIIYDLTDPEGLEGASECRKDVEEYASPDAEIVIIGNKCDLVPESEQTTDHLIVSAKDNVRVGEMFEFLCKKLVEKVKSGKLKIGEKKKEFDIKSLVDEQKRFGCC